MVSKIKLLLALCCVINCLLGNGVLCQDDFWDNISPEDKEILMSLANITITEEDLATFRPQEGDDDYDPLWNNTIGSSETAGQAGCAMGIIVEYILRAFNARPQSSQEVVTKPSIQEIK